jgi:hypothetical protein
VISYLRYGHNRNIKVKYWSTVILIQQLDTNIHFTTLQWYNNVLPMQTDCSWYVYRYNYMLIFTNLFGPTLAGIKIHSRLFVFYCKIASSVPQLVHKQTKKYANTNSCWT